MKIEKISCPLDLNGREDSKSCHALLKLINPNLLSISHIPNNHILINNIDYDINGHVLKSAFKINYISLFDENIKNKIQLMVNSEFV